MPQIVPSRLSSGTPSRSLDDLPVARARLRGSWRSILCYPIKVTGNEQQTAMAGPAWPDAGDRHKVNGAIPPGVSMMSVELTADIGALGQSPPTGRHTLVSVV